MFSIMTSISKKASSKKQQKMMAAERDADEFGKSASSVPQFDAKSLLSSFTNELYLVPVTITDKNGKNVGDSNTCVRAQYLDSSVLVKNVYASDQVKQMCTPLPLDSVHKFVKFVTAFRSTFATLPKRTLLVSEAEYKKMKNEKAKFAVAFEDTAVYGVWLDRKYCKAQGFETLGNIFLNLIYQEKKCGKTIMRDFSRTPELDRTDATLAKEHTSDNTDEQKFDGLVKTIKREFMSSSSSLDSQSSVTTKVDAQVCGVAVPALPQKAAVCDPKPVPTTVLITHLSRV